MLEQDVFVLILGANDGAYALCRAFYEDYGICPTVMDEAFPPLLLRSRFCRCLSVPHLSSPRIMMTALERFYEGLAGKSLFLLTADDAYRLAVEKERERLSAMFFLPHMPSGALSLGTIDGILALCVTDKGERRAIYAAVAAKNEQGMPLAAVISEPDSAALASISTLPRGIYFYALSDKQLLPLSLTSPLTFFVTAADTGVTEWLIRDYVLCEAQAEPSDIQGLFCLVPFRLLKHRLLPPWREKAKKLHRMGIETCLFTMKKEAKSMGFFFVLQKKLEEICR